MAEKKTDRTIATNRKAGFLYHILETLEAGISLYGHEVKAIRSHNANLKEAYISIEKGEAYLQQCHISPYKYHSIEKPDPARKRKLLIKKQEIKRLAAKVAEKGLTLIPLKIYLKGNYIKIEIALCKGKKIYDKREDIKKKDIEREMRRHRE